MLSVHSSTCLRVVFLLLHPLNFLQLIHFFIVQRGIHCFFGKTKYQLHSGQRKLCKENNENFCWYEVPFLSKWSTSGNGHASSWKIQNPWQTTRRLQHVCTHFFFCCSLYPKLSFEVHAQDVKYAYIWMNKTRPNTGVDLVEILLFI